MPVYRTPEGKIIEEKTVVSPPGGSAGAGPQRASRSGDTTVRRPRDGSAQPGPAPRGPGGYDEKTIVRGRSGQPRGRETTGGETAVREKPPEDGRTVIGPRGRPGGAPDPNASDLVTGWLVVIDGPGKGRDVRIGTGRSGLGRGENNRIPLPFGDTRISRDADLFIACDERHGRFSVAPSEKGGNLAYLGDTPIDTRLQLEDGATITIGNTTLRFVAFCGDRFNWSDVDG